MCLLLHRTVEVNMSSSGRFVSCLNCTFNCKDESELLSHVRIHQHEPNFRIPCVRCPQISRKTNSHLKHIKLCKANDCSIPPVRINEENFEFVWQCQNCLEEVKINKEPNLDDFQTVKIHCLKHVKAGAVPPCPVCGSDYKVKRFQLFHNHQFY